MGLEFATCAAQKAWQVLVGGFLCVPITGPELHRNPRRKSCDCRREGLGYLGCFASTLDRLGDENAKIGAGRSQRIVSSQSLSLRVMAALPPAQETDLADKTARIRVLSNDLAEQEFWLGRG